MRSNWRDNYSRYKDFFLNVLRVYNTKPNLKIYLELVLSLLTIAIFAIFAIKPTILTIIDLNKEIKNKQNTITKLHQKVKNLQTANNLMQVESENLKFVDEAIPDFVDPKTFIQKVENIANLYSIKLTGLSISEVMILGNDQKKKDQKDVVLPENANEEKFILTVGGTYPNLLLFVESIENFKQPIKVDSFSIKSSSIGEENLLILTMSGRLPYYNNQ